jgi:hypothetical protein
MFPFSSAIIVSVAKPRFATAAAAAKYIFLAAIAAILPQMVSKLPPQLQQFCCCCRCCADVFLCTAAATKGSQTDKPQQGAKKRSNKCGPVVFGSKGAGDVPSLGAA